MDYAARSFEFTSAVAAYWFWWLTAVPFFFDQILSKNFWSPRTNKRISVRWPEESRHRFFKWIAVAGFVISCFMAFDQVNSELKEQTKTAIGLKATNANLQASVKSLEDQLADSRRQLAEARKWIPGQPPPPQSATGPTGIRVGPGSKNITIEDFKSRGMGIGIDNQGTDVEMRRLDIAK
jgi:hypothetical protein